MGLLSRLFGISDGDGKTAAPASTPEQARTACPTCDRPILPASHCPFCQSQSFSKEMLTTLQGAHAPQAKLAALGGVIIATEAARQFGARGFLHIFQGTNCGETVLLASRAVTIGRDAVSNRLGLNDGNVSARHCEVRSVGEGFEVVDLGAKNGTFVNDSVVTIARLADGDVLAVGETRLYVGIL